MCIYIKAEDHKFEAILSNLVKPHLKKNKKNRPRDIAECYLTCLVYAKSWVQLMQKKKFFRDIFSNLHIKFNISWQYKLL